MEKNILIVKNIAREGPGLLEVSLKEQNISYEVVNLDKGQSFPSPENYNAVVVLGGSDSANDETEKMQSELNRIKDTLVLGLPYIGVCLGLQTLVKAAGGKVVRSATREMGFRDPESSLFTVQLTGEGKNDALFAGLGDSFKVFHLRGETVELTHDMQLLGVGNFCLNQIVKVGSNAYGIQGHFELTPEMFNVWLNEDPDLLQHDKKQLKAEFETLENEYTNTGRQLSQNFLKIVGF